MDAPGGESEERRGETAGLRAPTTSARLIARESGEALGGRQRDERQALDRVHLDVRADRLEQPRDDVHLDVVPLSCSNELNRFVLRATAERDDHPVDAEPAPRARGAAPGEPEDRGRHRARCGAPAARRRRSRAVDSVLPMGAACARPADPRPRPRGRSCFGGTPDSGGRACGPRRGRALARFDRPEGHDLGPGRVGGSASTIATKDEPRPVVTRWKTPTRSSSVVWSARSSSWSYRR